MPKTVQKTRVINVSMYRMCCIIITVWLKHPCCVQEIDLLQEQLVSSKEKMVKCNEALLAAEAALHAAEHAKLATASQAAAAEGQKASLQEMGTQLLAMCQTATASLQVTFPPLLLHVSFLMPSSDSWLLGAAFSTLLCSCPAASQPAVYA